MRSNLKKLTLRLCLNLGKESLLHILTKLKALECLDISGCINMDLMTLSKAKFAKNLRWLNIELLNPSSADLHGLSTGIEKLSLKSCLHLSDDIAKHLSYLPQLKQVNLENCPLITPEVIKYLNDKITNIEICV